MPRVPSSSSEAAERADHPAAAPRPRILAHRGFSLNGNENSLAAFRAATEFGVRWVETDVNTTADGVVVAIHDSSLERVAGVPGEVPDLPYAKVAEARLAGGEPIPTLAEALAALPDAFFNVDIKDEGSVEAFARVVAETGAVDRVRVASFSDSRRRRTLAALRCRGAVPRNGASESLAGPAPRDGADAVAGGNSSTGAVKSSPGVLGNGLFVLTSAVLPERWCARVWPVVARSLRRWLAPFDVFQAPLVQKVGPLRIPVASSRFIRAAHACGYGVHVWTINDAEEMRRLAGLGVDGLVTDRADVAVGLFPPEA